jgi:pimeloyl-ACP methyl ester carboxylesterase
MLTPALWALEIVELSLGLSLAFLGRRAGLSGTAIVVVLLLLAFGWRALLVLVSYWLAGLGKPSLRLWCLETLAFTRAYLAMTFAPALARLDRLRSDRDATLPLRLVFVHGWCCNAAVWRPLLRAWRRLGGAPPEVVTLAPVLGSLDEMAAHLERCLARGGADRRPILLVAHSMGGLVARRWLQDAGQGRGAGLLTIGTPHAGTRVARWGPGLAARQMRPGSQWLQRLPPVGGGAEATAVACVWSAVDAFVAPPASARPPGARAIEVTDVGHFGLLRSPMLLEALQEMVRAWHPQAVAPVAAGSR